jgi:hypothetical protein
VAEAEQESGKGNDDNAAGHYSEALGEELEAIK